MSVFQLNEHDVVPWYSIGKCTVCATHVIVNQFVLPNVWWHVCISVSFTELHMQTCISLLFFVVEQCVWEYCSEVVIQCSS